ncbi:hypothetical protein VCR3J2_40110 [Vibrio coralliirubri]|nr:hypothetical protein VCR3J2_40110 [Vibrio coralliirubri]
MRKDEERLQTFDDNAFRYSYLATLICSCRSSYLASRHSHLPLKNNGW